jgi:hypothetical protein
MTTGPDTHRNGVFDDVEGTGCHRTVDRAGVDAE